MRYFVESILFMPPDDDDGARSVVGDDVCRGGGSLLFHSRSSPSPPQSPTPPLPPPSDPVSRRPLPEAPGTGWALYSEQRMPDTDSMLSFQTFFFFVFLQIVVPRHSVRSSAAVVVVPRRSERSISVAAVAAVVPHGASKLTFTQQRAGGGGWR